jgi:hypothetical protein
MFAPIIPIPPVDIPVIDPGQQPQVILIPLLATLLVCQLVGGFPVFKNLSLYGVFLRLAVFVSLVSLPIFSYPTFHQWYFNANGQLDFWLGWTKYNAARFGGVHMPTFILAFLIMLAAWMTPKVALLLDAAVTRLVIEFHKATHQPLETVPVKE